MYIVIKDAQAERLEHKVHKLKELACDIMNCLFEAKDEETRTTHEEYGLAPTRKYPKRTRYDMEDYEEDYEEDYKEDYRHENPRMKFRGKRY